MSKKAIALCLAVFLLVWVGIAAWAEEKSLDRAVSERLIVQIDFSSWIGESFKVSLDSKRVACGVRAGDRWALGSKQFVVIDGEEGKRYDGIISAPIFSPDSKRVAYLAVLGDKWFVVIDGEEGKRYDGFVRGGRIIFDSPDSLHYLAQKGSNIYLVEERIK